MSSIDCIFCLISKGSVPSTKIFDDGIVFAIHDIAPKTPVHVLVIPHKHVEQMSAASLADIQAAAACLAAAPSIASQLNLDGTGYRLVANQGVDSGQEVPHFHLHILGGRRLEAMG